MDTFFSALIAVLRSASAFNRDDVVPPAAVLWPDEKREWERLIPRLRSSLPQLLTLGSFEPADRTGPAIWLRCVLAGKAAEVSLPVGDVPIIYLPGVSRATLRATDDCPPELKPLAEFQYRGVIWSQANSRDWTVAAFLQSDKGGLKLAAARDQGSAASLRRALEKLADAPLADLQAKSANGELNGNYFDSLVSDDLVDDLLSWMSAPKPTRDQWEPGRWETLCGRCLADYGFDPSRDGEHVAAEKLGSQPKNAWKTAWRRYAAAPARYPGLQALLRGKKPKSKGTLFDQAEESWPEDNESEEAELRRDLLDLAKQPLAVARQTLIDLEKKHGPRRGWVWAKLDQAPLASAVEHLAALAATTAQPLAGATLADMVQAYTEWGWRADAAVLDALAGSPKAADKEAITSVIMNIYKPWLRDGAEQFQRRAAETPLPGREVPRLGPVSPGICVLFADGLRYDVGRKLVAMLAGLVGEVELSHHFVALPSVTPSAKPAVSPVADKLMGTADGAEFRPGVAPDGKDLSTDRFRRLLEDDGVQFLARHQVGDPGGKAWTEVGDLDSTGHNEGIGLARRIPELLESLVRRVEGLLEAGWREVRVVTDHGWLLMPGGLPKAELPIFLTELKSRWRRCAVVKPTAAVDLPQFRWFWADDVRIACPPGIKCFRAGEEYNHGGLSLQECVVPRIIIRPGGGTKASAKIESLKWAGLRCRIKVVGGFEGCSVDLRDKAVDPSTSLAEVVKAVGEDGSVSLVLKAELDTREATGSTLVLLDRSGNVVDRAAVTVGG